MPEDTPRDPGAGAPRDPDLRVSDEQRDRAAEEIREHFAAGRLTDEELSERVQAAYSARTEQELKRLLSDLPKLPATPAQQKAEIVARRRQLQRRLVQEAGGGAALFLLCTVIWLVSGAHGQFWPIWVALVALIPLVRNGWRLYGPAPELDRVERELETRRQRDERRNRMRSETRADAVNDRRAARYERRRRER
ncbi:MAG: DUF1707 domain-containing protein [Solirubrobacterales bacterium]|nr:DUF1707 domain-containing protein [Solirubrobacterales bacterium]